MGTPDTLHDAIARLNLACSEAVAGLFEMARVAEATAKATHKLHHLIYKSLKASALRQSEEKSYGQRRPLPLNRQVRKRLR